MAKDGTNRGGARIGAGRKKKNHTVQIPKLKEYLEAEQRGGGQTCAAQVYQDTFDWLAGCDCAEYVNPQLVETFAQAVSRHVQAESEISRTGFIARHPTTGEPMRSPLVQISLDYLKAAQAAWYSIQQIVDAHTTTDDADDLLDLLGGVGSD